VSLEQLLVVCYYVVESGSELGEFLGVYGDLEELGFFH